VGEDAIVAQCRTFYTLQLQRLQMLFNAHLGVTFGLS